MIESHIRRAWKDLGVDPANANLWTQHARAHAALQQNHGSRSEPDHSTESGPNGVVTNSNGGTMSLRRDDESETQSEPSSDGCGPFRNQQKMVASSRSRRAMQPHCRQPKHAPGACNWPGCHFSATDGGKSDHMKKCRFATHKYKPAPKGRPKGSRKHKLLVCV